MIELHWETVSTLMREVMETVGGSDLRGRFYLAGGTALALQLGHRRSVDLDFFAEADEVGPETHRLALRVLGPFGPTIVEQALALLWLMARLKSARMGEALAAFEVEFGELIPAAHHGRNASGRIRWHNHVMWARFRLVRAGLMASGGHGVWAIAPAGEEWLQQNTHADSSDLAAYLRRGNAMSDGRFEWRGKRYEVSRAELLTRARRLLQAGPPPEAVRYKDWAVLVDGRPVSVKWLFALATGAEYNEFDLPTARRALARLGIQAQRAEPGGSEPALPAGPDRADRALLRDEFLERAAGHLRARLSPEFGYSGIRTYPGRNWVQLVFPGFGSCHYELWLARGHDEVGLHLEGRREENLARLAVLAPHADEFAAALGKQVVAAPWGSNWARLAIEMAPGPWTEDTAREYATMLARFVEVTLPSVRKAMATRAPHQKAKTTAKPSAASPPDGRAHAILDQQLAQIRAYLQGRALRPSDEVLCEWVQLCYLFELFAEGAELFQMVVPADVNEWLYARTSRLA